MIKSLKNMFFFFLALITILFSVVIYVQYKSAKNELNSIGYEQISAESYFLREIISDDEIRITNLLQYKVNSELESDKILEMTKESVAAIFKESHINKVWIIDFNKKKTIRYDLDGSVLSEQLPSFFTQYLTGDVAFQSHFFVKENGRIIEIYCVPIEGTGDYDKKEVRGILAAGRIWDEQYLDNLGNISNAEISIREINDFQDTTGSQVLLTSFTIVTNLVFKDNENHPIIEASFEKRSESLKELYNLKVFQFLGIVLFSAAVLVFVVLYLHLYVNKPLNRIINSVLHGDEEYLLKLTKRKNEYSKFAGFINKVLAQSKTLVEQIEQKNKIEKELAKRGEFESLIATLSTSFIGFETEEIDQAMVQSLSIIGNYQGVDKITLYKINKGKNQLETISEWSKNNTSEYFSHRKNIKFEEIDWWINKLYSFENIFIPDVYKFSEDVILSKTIKKPKDLLIIPLIIHNELLGCMELLSFTEEKRIIKEDIPLYRLAGEIFANVMERKKIEQKINAVNMIVENSPTIVFRLSVDENLTIEYVSRNISRFGYNYTEFITGKVGLKRFIYPEDYDRVINETRSHFNAGIENYSQEFRVVSKSGDIFYVDNRTNIIRDENGKALYLEAVLLDITDKKQVELCLVEKEKQYREIVNSVNEVIFQTDAAGLWTFLNPAWEMITGFTINESIGKLFLNYVHPDDRERNNRLFLPLIERKKESCRHTIRYLTKDGGFKWIEVHAKLTLSDSNEIIGTSGILSDVTERIKAEEALRIRENALQNSSIGVIIVDAKTEELPVIYVNNAFEYITGYSSSELLGKKTMVLFKHEESIEKLPILREAINRKHGCELIFRNIKKNGEIFWNELKTSPIIDINGEMTHYVGVLTDITERKKAEDDTKSALEKEKELNDMKSRLVSMISHEFRTPLTTIYSSAELIEIYGDNWENEKRKTYLRKIRKSSESLVEMLNYVLTISRADSGRMELNNGRINVLSYCVELCEEFQLNSNGSHEIKFKHEGLKSEYLIDEKVLGHILRNIISNAIKYSPGKSEVKFSVNDEGDKLRLIIVDYGIGIDENDLKNIFEMFVRGKNVGEIKGTGLGLAIVKKSVDLLRGTIEIKSSKETGTTVEVVIPI